MFRRLLAILGLGALYRSYSRRRYLRRPGMAMGMGAGGATLPLLLWLGWKNRDRLAAGYRRMVSGQSATGLDHGPNAVPH